MIENPSFTYDNIALSRCCPSTTSLIEVFVETLIVVAHPSRQVQPDLLP